MKAFIAFAIVAILAPVLARAAEARRPPNIVILLTDDQGFGELGVTGNPVVHTPNIDHFAGQSVWLDRFHVMPVCSPTRSCLMTGRYNYRTGVVDTFLGRSLMHPDETTLPQMLSAAGYRTGIFGKWHLGDNYPMRAMDRGFQETFVLNGGGLAQPGDPPDPADERGAYFNAVLRHNGTWTRTNGYVTDVLTDAALQFIEQSKDKPFFCYVPYNCPHDPHQVPDKYRHRYDGVDLGASGFPKIGNPMPAKTDHYDIASVYGMIDNIDENVGRILKRLDDLNLTDNTIVIFFSDNGCQKHNGYNAGLREWKGTPFEGGIHQFCFLRWPDQFHAGTHVSPIASVIDLTPTLLDLSGVAKPESVKFDGLSLAPLLRGEKIDWPDRTLFFQWHRGDVPTRYRAFAARSPQWKLVQPLGVVEKCNGVTHFQLFDMTNDPYELKDVAADHPDIVAKLKGDYDAWFTDVTSARDYTVPSRIFIGTPNENPVLLTRQDWRGPGATWKPGGVGYWAVDVKSEASYTIKILFDAPKSDTTIDFSCGGVDVTEPIKAGSSETILSGVHLPIGPSRIQAQLGDGPTATGVRYIEVIR